MAGLAKALWSSKLCNYNSLAAVFDVADSRWQVLLRRSAPADQYPVSQGLAHRLRQGGAGWTSIRPLIHPKLFDLARQRIPAPAEQFRRLASLAPGMGQCRVDNGTLETG